MFLRELEAETVGSIEKKFGFPPGTFRNSDGRDTRSDKKLATIRKEWRRKLASRRPKFKFVQAGLFDQRA
jgi:hypothetical protein